MKDSEQGHCENVQSKHVITTTLGSDAAEEIQVDKFRCLENIK